jgi:glycosyltransferase involved in cell wall biosynthesis
LKIAIIVNPLIPVPPEKYGGIERIVYMLVQELITLGHDITLFAHPDSKPGCKLVPYQEGEHYSLKASIRINRLTSKIARQGFDLVHTFGRMSNIALLMLNKIPKVVSYQLPPTLSQVKKAVRIARTNTLHFTACSNYIADQIKDHCDVTTIYNGVDMADYQFNGKVEPGAPFVFLGRIQKEKGTAIAIQMVKQTNNKLIIAGNVPAEAVHQQYFEEEVKPFIDQEQIKYIGPVNNAQKNELLRTSRALLMPVLWDEPFGIVMTEALACGTPVIGFKRGAVPEIVSNGRDGFVCKTEADMIAAIKNIDNISRTACRQVVEQKFSAGMLARQYEELYQQATGKK